MASNGEEESVGIDMENGQALEDEAVDGEGDVEVDGNGREEEDSDGDEDDDDDDNVEEEIEEIRAQAKVANRERLEDLSELIAKSFSYLRAETAIATDGEDFIRIVRKSLAGSRLRRAPTFGASIAKAGDVDDGGDVFTVELVLYNGRVVKNESIQYDECSEDRLNSKLLLKLNCGEYRLCKGLPKEALDSPDAKISELYVEPLNDGVSVRSRECELAMLGAVPTCSACVGLANRLCPEEKPSSPSSAVVIKIKPDLPEGGAESDEIDNDAGPEPIDVFHSDEDDDGEAVKKEKEPSTSSEASAQAASEFRSRLTSDSSKKTRCESNLQKLIKLGIIKVEPASDRPPKPKAPSNESLSITSTSEPLPKRGRGRPPLTQARGGLVTRPRQRLEGRPNPKVVLKSKVPVNFERRGGKMVATPVRRNPWASTGGKPPEGTVVRPIRRPPRFVDMRTVKKQAPTIPRPPPPPRVMQQCRICLYKHDKASVFERHVETHQNKFQLDQPVNCPVCNQLFPTKHELNPHFNESHDKEKGVCVECGEIVAAKSLRGHLESRHWVNVKNKLCPTCGKAFRTKTEIEVHLAVAHGENLQSVICDVCGKDLPHPKMLARHMSHYHVYQARGRVKCPFCEKILEKAMAWHKHIKIHSQTKPYRCGFCEYRSVKRHNVNLHMKKVHRMGGYDDLIVDGEFDFSHYGMTAEQLKIDNYFVDKQK